MKTFLRPVAVLSAVLGLAVAAAGAQAPAAAQAFNPQEVIPFDAAVHTGTLPNGLKYFIRQNPRPAKRVEIRLAVKAGSLEEADDQQGLAHLIEHMAFNGSEHFKPGELVSYFETYGARLGPHVNASTSFDETVYLLQLPTDNFEVVAKGLTAMADFAGGLSFIPQEVDKERGVVTEEWRGGLGAGSRIRDKQFPVLFYESHYADRLPIGKPEIIRDAPVERLRSFYDTWYRPERIGVVVVGDIDVAQVEATITSIFSPLKDRVPVAPPPNNAIPLPERVLVNVGADPELTSSSVQLIYKRSKDGNRLAGDYRRDLVETLFADMFDDRFSELARKADAKYLNAGVGGGSLGPTASMFSLSARVKDGGLAEGLAALQIEARRVREFGFTAAELDRAKKSLTAGYARAFNERDKSESGQFAQEYVAYFTDDEPSPGIAYEYRPGAARSAGHHARRNRGPGARTADGRIGRGAGDVATETQHPGADRSRSSRGARLGRQGRGDAVDRSHNCARTAVEQTRSGNRSGPPGDSVARRHRRDFRQRRRGVAEADRLQERSDSVQHVLAGRPVAGVARRLLQRVVRRRATSASPATAESRRSISARCWRARSAPRRRSSRIRLRASTARRRRPISKRRCSCST